MSNPLAKLDELLDTLKLKAIQKNQTESDFEFFSYTMMFLLFSFVFAGVTTACIRSFFEFNTLHFLLNAPLSFIVFISSFSVGFNFLSFLERTVLGREKINQEKNQLKEDSLKKIDKEFIFDLFSTFEKLSPFILKKSKITSLKKKIEKSMLEDDYQQTVMDLLTDFHINKYEKFKKQINKGMKLHNLTHEFENYKKESDTEHDMEINGDVSKTHKLKSTL